MAQQMAMQQQAAQQIPEPSGPNAQQASYGSKDNRERLEPYPDAQQELFDSRQESTGLHPTDFNGNHPGSSQQRTGHISQQHHVRLSQTLISKYFNNLQQPKKQRLKLLKNSTISKDMTDEAACGRDRVYALKNRHFRLFPRSLPDIS